MPTRVEPGNQQDSDDLLYAVTEVIERQSAGSVWPTTLTSTILANGGARLA